MTYQQFLMETGLPDNNSSFGYYQQMRDSPFLGAEPGAQTSTALGGQGGLMQSNNLGFYTPEQVSMNTYSDPVVNSYMNSPTNMNAYSYSSQVPISSTPPTAVMSQPTSTTTWGGASGADPALVSDYDVTGQEGLLDGAEGGEGLTAGQYQGMAMAGNMAGNMIDTHDKELVDTPMGNQGSVSGMLKGTTKGASTGATIGTMVAPGKGTAVGAVIGGTLGLLGGAQGYFDSRTPPQTRTQTVTPMRGAGFSGQATSLFG